MSNRWTSHDAVALVVIMLVAAVGCQTLHNVGLPGMEPYLKADPEKVAEERSHRENFAVHRDHRAMYWLLAHKIGNGMYLGEVEDVFGEPGEYTDEFKRLKSDGLIQMTDSAYRWGPDSKGYSAVVFFRDKRVINFNRKDYAEPLQ